MNILVCRLRQLTDFCHIFPLSFVTYSAAPARRHSFAEGSLGRIMNYEILIMNRQIQKNNH